uniref:Uncharacterized protein LOC102809205 n=1 Tax=Saccoglossus kowalevskii TaxID=10224 RepID=A0ABM0LYR3_SACKO|nr:PREDICTED: uncharacterized protein LOC102809205 [Saccoglossus kowalevskii]
MVMMDDNSHPKLLRQGSGSKMALKEKIVQIYEAFFKGEDPSRENPNFWEELFLLKANVQYLESELEKLTPKELLAMKFEVKHEPGSGGFFSAITNMVGSMFVTEDMNPEPVRTSEAECPSLLDKATHLLVVHRTATCDILQCYLALLAGATTVQQDAVLDACQGVRHCLSHAGWTSSTLFDVEMAGVVPELRSATNWKVQVESASQLATAKDKQRAPQAQKTHRPKVTSDNQSQPGGKHSYPFAGGKSSGVIPGKKGLGGGSSSSLGGRPPWQRGSMFDAYLL